jgi:hypothetical protein
VRRAGRRGRQPASRRSWTPLNGCVYGFRAALVSTPKPIAVRAKPNKSGPGIQAGAFAAMTKDGIAKRVPVATGTQPRNRTTAQRTTCAGRQHREVRSAQTAIAMLPKVRVLRPSEMAERNSSFGRAIAASMRARRSEFSMASLAASRSGRRCQIHRRLDARERQTGGPRCRQLNHST